MLVRFVGSEPHSWLRKDCEYVVLAVGAERGSGGHDQLTFMIHHQGDRGAFDWGWWSADLFEVASPELPSNWVFHQHHSGRFDLIPAAWCRPGHWEDLDPSEGDHRPGDVLAAASRRAWADYHSERDRILSEAGRPPGRRGLPGPSCSFRPPTHADESA
jgi:hypothetical protein